MQTPRGLLAATNDTSSVLERAADGDDRPAVAAGIQAERARVHLHPFGFALARPGAFLHMRIDSLEMPGLPRGHQRTGIDLDGTEHAFARVIPMSYRKTLRSWRATLAPSLLLALFSAGCGSTEAPTQPPPVQGSDAGTSAEADAAPASDAVGEAASADSGDGGASDAREAGSSESGDDAGDSGDAAGAPVPWVVSSAGGRYFMTEDGEPFVVIGHQPGTGFLDLAAAEMEEHFARMEKFGETVARIDYDYVFYGTPARYEGLETTPGIYDPAHVARLDAAYALAAKHGVRLLAVPWLTSPPMWPSWPLNPYHQLTQGHPHDDPYGFLLYPEALAAYGARMEWISARWGKSGTFLGWDLMNESDVLLDWSSIDDPAALGAWVHEIGTRVRDFEVKTHGRTHPRMVSWSSTVPPAAYGFLFDSDGLDTAATHPYDLFGTIVTNWPNTVTSVVEPAIAMHGKVKQILGTKIHDRRPYVENERSPNTQTMLRFYREANHDMAWAELASGAAGTGITWLWPGATYPDPLAELRRRHEALGPDHRALRDFVDGCVPSAYFLSDTIDEALDVVATQGTAITPMSARRGRYAIGWLLGNDERCVLVDAVNEVRQRLASQDAPEMGETLFAVVLWRGLLLGDGVALDDAQLAALLAAAKAKDAAAIKAELPGVWAYLEGLETQVGTLAALAACPVLSPTTTVTMPAGDYVLDWIDDTTAKLVATSPLSGGGATLKAPSFTRHIAFVVRPAS
jgi:hypothetical protein